MLLSVSIASSHSPRALLCLTPISRRGRERHRRVQLVSLKLPTEHHPLTTALVEVAIHTILYVRQVYPADVFVRRKKYNTPVFQSRHPGLNDYISGAVKAVTDELALVSDFPIGTHA